MQASTRLAALRIIPQDDLLRIQAVNIRVQPHDLPGKPLDEVICEMCGEVVKDIRQATLNDKTVCRPCSQGRDYYTVDHNLMAEPGLEGFIELELEKEAESAIL